MGLSSPRQAGFSLLETMVAVGITGVITAIAIPNFTRMRNRSQQTEAKNVLSMLYAAEKAFHTEQTSFTGCLRKIGIIERDSKRYYSVGFDNSVVYTTTGCGPGSTSHCDYYFWKGTVPRATCLNTVAQSPQHGFKATHVAHAGPSPIHPDNFSDLSPAATTVLTKDTFTAVAVGIILPSGSGTNYDGWRINESKSLFNFQFQI